MSDVVDEVPVDVGSGRVYAEGWQSWSPATWYPLTARGLRPDEEWQHLMRFRPGTPVAEEGVQGEGLLVVDPGSGDPVRLYGSTDPVSVPTLQAVLEGDRVVVRVHRSGRRTRARGGRGRARGVRRHVGLARRRSRRRRCGAPGTATSRRSPRPTCWRTSSAFARQDLAVDVVQIDDGWSPGLGEGLRESERFGSLPAVVDAIRASGRRAGIWLAPFVVGGETTLARDHPDWLVGPAGRNWGQDLLGLDLSHPGVQELLVDAVRRLVDMGVDYLKLDFLYAGAVPGRRHADVDGVAAYRDGLALVREAAWPDVYLVGCGAPLLPSVGLVDAMRVSPDTFHEGGEDGSTGLRGLMPLAARAWQQGRLWANDPDCVVARPSYSQRERWADAARRLGGLRSFSDRVAELDDWGLATVRGMLAEGGSGDVLPLEQVRAGARLAQGELTA